MKALVTGCAGFIGSHLTEKLLENHEVMGMDCFSDYYPREIKESNLAPFKNHKNMDFLEQDILKADLKSILEDVDVVFHLAAQAGVRASWGENFKVYTDNDILATQRLLEACKGTSIKKFVYSSSSSVYGDVKSLPMKETDMPAPVSPYGVSKLASEHLCNLYFKNYGIPTVSLRYFTVYGPRQRPDMAFNKFVKAIETRGNITIYGDGKQTRDFTYVSDIVDGTIRAGQSNPSGEVYNLAGGSRVSVLEVIELLERLTGKKANTEHIEQQKGDVTDTYGDISKAGKAFGYSPKTGIEEGLRKYIEWLNQ